MVLCSAGVTVSWENPGSVSLDSSRAETGDRHRLGISRKNLWEKMRKLDIGARAIKDNLLTE